MAGVSNAALSSASLIEGTFSVKSKCQKCHKDLMMLCEECTASDIPVTETQTNTEKIFNTDTIYI